MTKEKTLSKKINKQNKLEEFMSKDFIEGLKAGLKIAKNVVKRQGYEITFPKIDNMLIERMEEKE